MKRLPSKSSNGNCKTTWKSIKLSQQHDHPTSVFHFPHLRSLWWWKQWWRPAKCHAASVGPARSAAPGAAAGSWQCARWRTWANSARPTRRRFQQVFEEETNSFFSNRHIYLTLLLGKGREVEVRFQVREWWNRVHDMRNLHNLS